MANSTEFLEFQYPPRFTAGFMDAGRMVPVQAGQYSQAAYKDPVRAFTIQSRNYLRDKVFRKFTIITENGSIADFATQVADVLISDKSVKLAENTEIRINHVVRYDQKFDVWRTIVSGFQGYRKKSIWSSDYVQMSHPEITKILTNINLLGGF